MTFLIVRKNIDYQYELNRVRVGVGSRYGSGSDGTDGAKGKNGVLVGGVAFAEGAIWFAW